MGVTRRLDHLHPVKVEEDAENIIGRFNYADFDFSESGDELPDSVQDNDAGTDYGTPATRSRKNKERRAERKMRRFLDVENGGMVVKNSMGSRRQRRLENFRILMNFADKEDICSDFSDIVPHTVTSFERLFLDEKSMQIWNDFVERDEEEQRKILEEGELKGDGCSWFVVGGESRSLLKSLKSQDVDGRKHHPAYYGKACFDRMDRRSKRLLCEKRLPWGFIDNLEGELLSFFCSTSPTASKDDSVYVGMFENPLERALAHAIAQFLMLKSKSISVRGSGERLTEFRNPRAFYVPPHVRLIPYLSSIRSEPIEIPRSSSLGEDANEKEQSPNSSFSDVDQEGLEP